MTDLLELEVVHMCGSGGLQDGMEVRETRCIDLKKAKELAKSAKNWQKLIEMSGVPLICTLCGRTFFHDNRGGHYLVNEDGATLRTFPTFDNLVE